MFYGVIAAILFAASAINLAKDFTFFVICANIMWGTRMEFIARTV